MQQKTKANRVTHPIPVRFGEPDIHLMDHAAQLLGTTRNELIRSAAIRQAKRVIGGQRVREVMDSLSDSVQVGEA